MADITQYVSDSNQTASTTTLPSVDTSAPADAVMAPTIADSNQASPSKDELDVQIRQEKLAALVEAKEERASIREMKAAQVEADRQRAEESEIQQRGRQVAEGLADSAATLSGTIRATASKVSAAIGAVPIPGDLDRKSTC